MNRRHPMPFGAECRGDGSVRFRLWSPGATTVRVVLEGKQSLSLPMAKKDGEWFELTTDSAKAGSHYQYLIDERSTVPDPASRFQPADVHGPSEVIDAGAFDWSDRDWQGRPWEEAVIYELHVGAFTSEGTFSGVEKRLDYLSDIGITAIELMPVSDFPGKRSWGYDGVLHYAPDSSYGRPEDLKHLIQAAHAKGLMIFLDVVYNHFGPDGNYLPTYAPEFFTDRHCTPWGDAINFDGAHSGAVRDFFLHNALYWLEEYHFDGLRFDAVHAIKDDSDPDILTELAETVRSTLGAKRHIHLVLENGDNASRYLTGGKAGGYDAQWNDDIHQSLHVLVTGETDGYYSDYAREPVRHLGRCLAEGFAFQGDFSEYQGAKRGEPSANLPPVRFVNFLQDHDQIGNRAFGERIGKLADDSAVKAAMAVLLLAPSPPLLFMGEEFGADTPFLFFCDFTGDLASAVTTGRRGEFSRFKKFSSPEMLKQIPDPNSEKTFEQSKIDWRSVSEPVHQSWLNYYRELLLLRRTAVIPHLNKVKGCSGTYRVEGNTALMANWALGDDTSLTLLANLGPETARSVQRPIGELIFERPAKSSVQRDELPPWYVAWFFQR